MRIIDRSGPFLELVWKNRTKPRLWCPVLSGSVSLVLKIVGFQLQNVTCVKQSLRSVLTVNVVGFFTVDSTTGCTSWEKYEKEGPK